MTEPHPYFQVNLKDKTEVLCDGKHFARTNSHADSMRIVMAMEITYKQIKKDRTSAGSTTSPEKALEKSVRWLETNVPHFTPYHKKWYLEYMNREPTKAELRQERER